jgi:hypothetical protein
MSEGQDSKSKRGTKTLENGAVYDLDAGRIVKAPTRPPFSDPEFARDVTLARWKRNREAFIEGAAKALNVPTNDADVIRAIAEKVAANLRDSKNSRGTAELARFLVEHAKLLPHDEAGQGNAATFSPKEIRVLLRILRENPDVIEGEVSTDEE